MQQEVGVLLESLRLLAETGEPFNVGVPIGRMTLEIVGSAAFG